MVSELTFPRSSLQGYFVKFDIFFVKQLKTYGLLNQLCWEVPSLKYAIKVRLNQYGRQVGVEGLTLLKVNCYTQNSESMNYQASDFSCLCIAQNQPNYKPKLNYTWCSTKTIALSTLHLLSLLSQL